MQAGRRARALDAGIPSVTDDTDGALSLDSHRTPSGDADVAIAGNADMSAIPLNADALTADRAWNHSDAVNADGALALHALIVSPPVYADSGVRRQALRPGGDVGISHAIHPTPVGENCYTKLGHIGRRQPHRFEAHDCRPLGVERLFVV